jgi:hypothetical protein
LPSHALALDERRCDFKPHNYVPGRHTSKVIERWFVGDHSDVGGRFDFRNLDKTALANPPFRWIVYAAVHASRSQPLLFKGSSFHNFFPILIYSGRQPDAMITSKFDPAYIIDVNYLHQTTPTDDSQNANGPTEEDGCMRLEVHKGFSLLARGAQLLRRKGLHGNARDLRNIILHASVSGKLQADENYGGKRRDMLLALPRDEII